MMSKLLATTVFTFAVGFLLAASVPAGAANLVTNGSFETGAFSDNTGQDTMVLGVGATTMSGWTVAGSESLAWIGPANPFGLSASDGSYYLDLTGYNFGGPYSGVTQSIATSAGSKYLLSFDLGSSGNYGIPDGISASAAAASTTFTSTGTGSSNWETETMAFTALGSSTTISLIGASGNNYIGLDNVSVIFVSGPVPEPMSLALFGAGLVGLGLIRRKRI